MAASYPTSVKTFTTKAAAQKILAAHVNDLQDEVAAVEGGLLNGIAHNLLPDATNARNLGSTAKRWVIDASQLSGTLNSSLTVPPSQISSGALSTLVTLTPAQISSGAIPSNVTVAAPQVSSGALSSGVTLPAAQVSSGILSCGVRVLAASLQSTAAASGATFYRGDGEWAVPAYPTAPTFPVCVVALDTNVTVAKNTETGLNWLVENDDRSGMHSTAVNSSRITFADSTGGYLVGASICLSTAPTATGRKEYLRLVLNDTTTIVRTDFVHVLEHLRDDVRGLTVSGYVRAQSTSDYVTVRVLQASDTAMSVLSTNVRYGNQFWAAKQSS